MAKPFTFTPAENATPEALAKIRKPGWHKRARASEKAFRPRTAARACTSEADAKARQYAEWLAARDGVDLSGLFKATVIWLACAAGMRPRAVSFEFGGKLSGLSVLLPHWSYVAPAVVETHVAPWAAPVVAEVTGEARTAILAAFAEADAALWLDATASAYPEPAAWAIGGTDGEPAPRAPDLVRPAPLPAVVVVDEPAPAPAVLVHPVEAIATATPVEGIGPEVGPNARTHPVVAMCLTDGARLRLFATVLDGTAPAPKRKAAGGAWLLSVDDAMALQAVASIRLIGLPRRRYSTRHLPPVVAHPVEGIALSTPVEAIPQSAFTPRGGRVPATVTFHAAP